MILQYAQAVVLQEMALEQLFTEGITILDTTHGDGTEKRRHPSVITWRTACEVARAAAMRLGVAPLDRLRVVSTDKGEMDLAELLFQNVTAHDR